MNSVRVWSASICMVALAASILQSLVPNGSMERMLKFIIGAFVICTLIQPLSRVIPEMKINLEESKKQSVYSQLADTVEKQYSEAAEESIRNLVAAELNKLDIRCKNVTVNMDRNENGSISINRVIVILAKGYDDDCQRAKNHLEKTLGIKMEVTADDGNG